MRITLWMIANVTGIEKLNNLTPASKKGENKNFENLRENLTGAYNSLNKNEMDKFCFDTILMYQNEPNKVVLTLSTLVFNVNLDLYVFDGSFTRGSSQEINYTKTKFSASNLNELPLINISYFLSNYYKVYNKQFSQKHNKHLLQCVSGDFQASIKIGNNFTCDRCEKDSKKIYFEKYSLKSCENCVKIYLDKLIEKRAEAFFSEDFNNRECK